MTEPIRTELPTGSVLYHDNDGRPHRVDGPAYVTPHGMEFWYQNGRLHRVGGPAFVTPDGYQAWYQYGLLHRADGPARICQDGTTERWVNGERRLDLEQDTSR